LSEWKYSDQENRDAERETERIKQIEAEIRTLNRIECSEGRKIQDFQRDPMGIPTRSLAMRLGKKRLTYKAYTTKETPGQSHRQRERERREIEMLLE
jgi:hypothetical protein